MMVAKAKTQPDKPDPKETLEESRIRRIKLYHDEMLQLGRTSLAKAICIGELLAQQKSAVEHGSWGQWLRDNLPAITQRTATNYMKLWEKKDEIKSETISNLTEAYRLLSGLYPKPAKKKGKPKPDDDADKPPKQLTLELTEDEKKEVDKMTPKLMEVLKVDSVKDMILKVIRHAYKELVNAKDYPLNNGSKRGVAHKPNGKNRGPEPLPNGRQRKAG